MRPNPHGVASIHRVPATELRRPDASIPNQVPGADHPVLRMPLCSTWIAAPTAALRYQFREWLLCGCDTRVAHFDRPRFARR